MVDEYVNAEGSGWSYLDNIRHKNFEKTLASSVGVTAVMFCDSTFVNCGCYWYCTACLQLLPFPRLFFPCPLSHPELNNIDAQVANRKPTTLPHSCTEAWLQAEYKGPSRNTLVKEGALHYVFKNPYTLSPKPYLFENPYTLNPIP